MITSLRRLHTVDFNLQKKVNRNYYYEKTKLILFLSLQISLLIFEVTRPMPKVTVCLSYFDIGLHLIPKVGIFLTAEQQKQTKKRTHGFSNTAIGYHTHLFDYPK